MIFVNGQVVNDVIQIQMWCMKFKIELAYKIFYSKNNDIVLF